MEGKAAKPKIKLTGKQWGIVITAVLKTQLVIGGDTYTITVSFTKETGIPDDAVLEVSELTEGLSLYGQSYEEYVAKTENALGMEEGSAGYIRLFDIKIVDQDDHSVKYQPKEGAFVDVRIELADKDASKEEEVPAEETVATEAPAKATRPRRNRTPKAEAPKAEEKVEE